MTKNGVIYHPTRGLAETYARQCGLIPDVESYRDWGWAIRTRDPALALRFQARLIGDAFEVLA